MQSQPEPAAMTNTAPSPRLMTAFVLVAAVFVAAVISPLMHVALGVIA